MSVGGFFSSESKTEQRTNNAPITGSDSAFIQSYRVADGGRVNSDATKIRVGPKGSYSVTNNISGVDADDLDRAINARLGSLGSTTGLPESADEIADAAHKRAKDQIVNGPADAKKKDLAAAIIVGVILFIAFVSLFLKKHTRHA